MYEDRQSGLGRLDTINVMTARGRTTICWILYWTGSRLFYEYTWRLNLHSSRRETILLIALLAAA